MKYIWLVFQRFSNEKRDVRAFPTKTSWGTTRPLIGQAAHGRRAGIILLTAWPIRGNFVPHENGGKLTLTSLFDKIAKKSEDISSRKVVEEVLVKYF